MAAVKVLSHLGATWTGIQKVNHSLCKMEETGVIIVKPMDDDKLEYELESKLHHSIVIKI